MSEPQRIAITVQRRNRSERFELKAGGLRIGSAAHCDVRLAPDEAAPEHLGIDTHERGVVVHLLAAEGGATIDGVPLTAMVVTSDAVVELGPLKLELRLLAPETRSDRKTPLTKKIRDIALITGVAIAYYVVLYEEPTVSVLDLSVPPPALFGGREGARCRHGDRESAEAYAGQQLAAANAKRERAPYAEHDGVQAVALYADAAACFRSAGRHDDAEQSARAARELASQIQADLHNHQVRLEWALERRRYAQAVQEVRVLANLTAERTDSHARWLAAVARALGATAQR